MPSDAEQEAYMKNGGEFVMCPVCHEDRLFQQGYCTKCDTSLQGAITALMEKHDFDRYPETYQQRLFTLNERVKKTILVSGDPKQTKLPSSMKRPVYVSSSPFASLGYAVFRRFERFDMFIRLLENGEDWTKEGDDILLFPEEPSCKGCGLRKGDPTAPDNFQLNDGVCSQCFMEETGIELLDEQTPEEPSCYNCGLRKSDCVEPEKFKLTDGICTTCLTVDIIRDELAKDSIPQAASDLVAATISRNLTQEELEEQTKELRGRITKLQAELDAMCPELRELLTEQMELIEKSKQALTDEWPDPDTKQYVVAKYTINYKTTVLPKVLKEDELVEETRYLKERPFTYKWNNPKLRKLIEAKALDPESAVLEERHHIAIAPPKEVEE